MFTSDGSAKSLLVDEKMTVGNVTRILAEKNHVSLDPKWALVELVPDLYMERVYEDHEMLVENCLLWKVDSKIPCGSLKDRKNLTYSFDLRYIYWAAVHLSEMMLWKSTAGRSWLRNIFPAREWEHLRWRATFG